MKILQGSLSKGGVWYPAKDEYDDLEFVSGLGRVIIIGKLVARGIWVGENTHLYGFDPIKCATLRAFGNLNVGELEAESWIEVEGRLGTFSCKAQRIHARGAITAARNLEAVYEINTMASISIGGHIICEKGNLSAADGINCGNTITVGGDIFTPNGCVAGGCTWRRDRNNDVITAGSVNAGLVFGKVNHDSHNQENPRNLQAGA